ncbi:MAG TPA: NAD(P)H-dependent glycerol-3-phosphate dehydrogenase [Dehalococcoidia bacterium]|nr:NAD(P)H-dependent glycerol-3-phosphate dehydrogenase [Dehalococcoidia bacterium]
MLGAGNMGTALAHVIAGNGHNVRVWSIEEDVLEEVQDSRRNTKYLDGILLHPGITPVWGLAAAIEDANLIIVSVPSQVVPSLAREIAPHVKFGQTVLNVAKGLQGGTNRRMSEVLAAEMPQIEGCIGSMGGPAIAIEMARGVPMAVVVGFGDPEACRRAQSIIQGDHLKVETTTDLAGLELCATLKNVFAIALGICDGMGFGTNTKAFVATLAVHEMARICGALGGRGETVFGLAGLGDLLTTGFSEHSRNRTLGEKMGSAANWGAFLRSNTVEGVGACRAIHELIDGKGLDVHLADTLHEILSEERPAPEAMRHFLTSFTYG